MIKPKKTNFRKSFSTLNTVYIDSGRLKHNVEVL